MILVIILVFLKIFYDNNSKNNESTSNISIVPTQIPTGIPLEAESEDINPSKNYVSVLPYLGKKMQITGIKSPKVLEIIIENEEDKNEVIEEVELWKKQYPIFKDYTFEFTIRKSN